MYHNAHLLQYTMQTHSHMLGSFLLRIESQDLQPVCESLKKQL